MTSRDTVGGRGYGRQRAGGFPSARPRRLADLRLLLVRLLLALACALPRALAADTIDIAATVGFTDTFRPGHWTPLTVTVTNRGSDIIGELEVQVTGDDALRGRLLVTSRRRTLELHRDSRKSLQFIVHPQGLSHPLVVRVRSGDEELARAEIDLRTRFAAQRLLLVLSRNADLDYLNDGSVDGLRVLYPHPELLPAHWRGYDAVAAIVLHGVSLERLSASQFEALHKWIAQGGILAVSGGVDYAVLRTPRLASLLPGVPLGMARVAADELHGAFSASLDRSRPIHVNRLGAFQGEVRLRAGNVPLIVERALGLGRVLYLTFDVASHPFDRWDGMHELLLQSLRLPPLPTTSSSASEPGLATPLMELIRARAADFPGSATVFLFLILYLGLLLAGHAIPVREGRRRWLAPLRGWGAPILFAPAAWLLFGPSAFPRGATAAAVALIEPLPDSGFARLGLELGVFANRSGPLRLEYRGAEPVLYPHRQALREGKVQDWAFGGGPRPYVEPLDQRRYVLHALEGEDVIAFRLEASVHVEATGPRLVLNNGSGRSLEDLWLVFDGHAYALGTVAAGARLERRLVASSHGIEVGAASWQELLRSRPGAAPQMLAPTRMMLLRRLQDAGRSGFPGPGHALVIAQTSNPLRPAGASAAWSHLESALVAFRLAVAASPAPAGETKPAEPDEGEVQRLESSEGRSPVTEAVPVH
ncbi:MAG: hypothetical protein GEV05_11265 [Betaproteobacteria bacterium]|nr:hypothetical protein [Betaproteobacteria bacterium]